MGNVSRLPVLSVFLPTDSGEVNVHSLYHYCVGIMKFKSLPCMQRIVFCVNEFEEMFVMGKLFSAAEGKKKRKSVYIYIYFIYLSIYLFMSLCAPAYFHTTSM